MTELLCDIIETTTIGENEYFVVYSKLENKKYTIPVYQLSKYNVEIGQKHYFFKELNAITNKYFLNYDRPEILEKGITKNNHYEVGLQYDFKIISIDLESNKKGDLISKIKLEDLDKNQITVPGLKWQKKDIWKFTSLKCEVESILNGIPRLLNKDFRHPLFEIGKEYEFKVIEQKTKETDNGLFNVFILNGIDDCLHEVNMLPGQKINNVKIEKITCLVKNISYRLHLYQVNIKDPFFLTFDKIVNNKELEQKYFLNILNISDNANQDIVHLVEQYNSKSALWVLTYTNKILSKRFRETIERQDFKQAKEINKLIITFEEWIIKKGIITTFLNEVVRNNTILKAKKTLQSAKLYDEILYKLSSNQFDILSDESIFKNKNNLVESLYYIINFTSINLLKDDFFVFRLIEIIKSANFESESEFFYLNKLLYHISYNKKIFISDEEKEYFSLSTSNIRSDKFSVDEIKYLNWSYCEIIIAQKLKMNEHVNILCGQILKIFTKFYLEIEKKEHLLFNAYRYFENYQSTELKLPFTFNDQLVINFDLLESSINNDNETNRNWEQLENLFTSNDAFTVTLSKKSKTGYEVIYNKLKGFLPYHLIKDKKLKSYLFEESNFSIVSKCVSISRAFNFFIIEQIENTDSISNHKIELNSSIGNIYDAVIKRVESYGLFLNTRIGEGLLHKKEIFDFNWDALNIDKYFKAGQSIKVVLKSVDIENKISFNFHSLKDRDLIYYNNYVERIFSFNVEDFFEIEKENIIDSNFEKTQIEKAFCIEQFAVLQFDIYQKIQNFQIAKQYYRNANHARSFLINIYTSYFEILLKIKAALENNSLEHIDLIKNNAKEIKSTISHKTIEIFPDSDKLIFFLDMISMFNEKGDSLLEELFDYIKKYNSETKQKDLRTVAKITLANNLLISESKEDSGFTLNNLRLIYDYLSNGVLSLEETIENKNARELKEEILYWNERIKEDESETLEFKSSFYTPILDEISINQLNILNNIENKTEKIINDISRINGDLARKKLIHSSLKTLVAFANSSGGTLLIGVNNYKIIIGLENEYLSTNPKLQYSNRDGFGLYFDDMVRNYIGDSFSSLMTRKFLKFPNGDVLIVKVEPSNYEFFLKKNDEGKDQEQLYIRNLSSTKELTGSELTKYIKNRQTVILKGNISE